MKKLFGIWTALVALTVSAVAAYYSIIGLTAIFAAAIIPVIIMGSTLEVAKITTAVWLHTFWQDAPLLMKTYLTSATIVLMLITSMGIFGFLSKAHIEQSAGGTDVTARIERVDQDITRQQQIITRAQGAIVTLDARVDAADTGIQDKIVDQQQLITQIENRLARDIATQNAIVDQELDLLSPLRDELTRVDARRQRLQVAIEANDVRTLQTLVGATVDGVYGPQTASRVDEFRTQLDDRHDTIFAELERLQSVDNIIVQQARTEILQLQDNATAEIQRASNAINQFRDKLLDVTAIDNTIAIADQELVIDAANTQIDTLYDAKFELQSELRQIEIEVGPVKYIAELVYGEASPDILEQAVRWVIIVLVLVFDPLAIVLVLAGLSLLRVTEADRASPPPSRVAPTPSVYTEPTVIEREIDSSVLADLVHYAQKLSNRKSLAEHYASQEVDDNAEAAVEQPLPPTVKSGFTGNDVDSDTVTVVGKHISANKI